MVYTNIKKIIGAAAATATALSAFAVPVSSASAASFTPHVPQLTGARLFPHKDHKPGDDNTVTGKGDGDKKVGEVKHGDDATKEKDLKLHADRQAELAKEHTEKIANFDKNRDKAIADKKRVDAENKAKADKMHQDKLDKERAEIAQRDKDAKLAKDKAAEIQKEKADHDKTKKH